MSRPRLVIALLLGVTLLSACADLGPRDDDASAALDEFAKRTGIEVWPSQRGCAYDRSFRGRVVGLVLEVQDARHARAPWDGRCVIPIEHELTGWPRELPPGWYVVTVTAADDPGEPAYMRRNRHLRVLGVLGTESDCKSCIMAAMRRMCAAIPAADRTVDEFCEGL